MKTIETLYGIEEDYKGNLRIVPLEVKFTAKLATVTGRPSALQFRTRFEPDRIRQLLATTPELAAKKYVADLESGLIARKQQVVSQTERIADAKKQLTEYLCPAPTANTPSQP